MATLHIQLLGEFRLTYGDEAVTTLPQTRQQAFLAYLLCHRQAPQARQHLAFLFWPDSAEEQAHNNLRKLLHRLRHALPQADTFLYADAKTIQWRPDAPFVLDVAEFEANLAAAQQAETAGDLAAMRAYLATAVQLYRGDLLPGCYDDWLLSERERLREALFDALTRLLRRLEDARDYATAIRYANQLLRHDPLHEETYHRLMRLHALNDDRPSALRTYHTCATLLQRELGVDPSQPIQEAYARLLALETPPVLQPKSAQRRTGAPGRRDLLVGRQGEWQQLLASWQRALQGHAQMVVISGEAGIGKSRLAEELRHWVSQQGLAAVHARAYAAEGALAYAPVTEWLRIETLRKSWQSLAGIWLTELARLLPELLIEQPHLPRPEPLTESWQRQRLFEALARAVLASSQPLLLMLDDLQWCDRETVEWLHYLLRFDGRARLLVVGTVRPEEVANDHPLITLDLALQHTEQLHKLSLQPLDTAETATLASQVAGHALEAGAVQLLYQATEGNPLFIVETVRARQLAAGNDARATTHPQALPPKIQAVIQHRLQQLSSAAREVTSLAAVIGRSFTFALLAQASTLSEDSLVRALDELWQRRLVREQGTDTYDFSHDRIREVAYSEISPVRRRHLHRQVAQALATLHTDTLDNVCSQLAYHYEQVGAAAEAVTYYQRAATVTYRIFAYTETVAHLNKLLGLFESLPKTAEYKEQKLDALLQLAEVLLILKGYTAPEVEATYNQAQVLCESIGHSEKRFSVLRGLWIYWVQRCQWQTAATLEEAMLLLAEQTQDPVHLRIVFRDIGATLFHQGRFEAAHAYIQRASVLPYPQQELASTNHGRDVRLVTLYRLTETLWVLGYPDQAQARMDEALTLARTLAKPFELMAAFDYVLELAHNRRQQQGGQALVEEYGTLIAKHPFPYYVAAEMINRGWLLAQAGQVSAGITLLKQAFEAWRNLGILLFLPYYRAWLVELYGCARQFEQGLALLAETLALAEATGEQFWSAELHRLRGELLLAQGSSADKVEACFQQAVDLARQQGAKSLELRATTSLARLWQAQGKCQAAYRMLSEIYNWFTEGFGTVDLMEARALLAEL